MTIRRVELTFVVGRRLRVLEVDAGCGAPDQEGADI
jgi:hypothetical protein